MSSNVVSTNSIRTCFNCSYLYREGDSPFERYSCLLPKENNTASPEKCPSYQCLEETDKAHKQYLGRPHIKL